MDYNEQQIYSLGKVAAYMQHGLDPHLSKNTLLNGGFTKEATDELMQKEAYYGAIARILGQGIMRGGGALARGAKGLMSSGAAKTLAPNANRASRTLGKVMQTTGNVGQRAGHGLARSGLAFSKNPAKAVGGGALQAGRSMLTGGGTGLGGAIGRGAVGASTASMLLPGGQEPQLPQPYGQYRQ